MIGLQYKMEKDGVVETRVEQKITIQSDGDPIDHDRALADAIQEATMMNPDMTVEKIEIQQQSSIQWFVSGLPSDHLRAAFVSIYEFIVSFFTKSIFYLHFYNFNQLSHELVVLFVS